MSKVISVVNQKGGVGKTTSTYNLAAVLALKGYKTLMCDIDSQTSLTISVGYDPLDFETTIVNVFEKDSEIVNAIYDVEGIENLSILPSHPYLAGVEMKLINQMSREKRLKKALNHTIDIFDFILIDCPPQLSLITINALSASDFVVVPCETSQLSFVAIEPLLDTIQGIKEELNENLEVLGVVATLFDSRTLIDRMVLEVIKKEHNLLGVIKRAVVAKKGLEDGLPTVIKEPKSDIAVEYINIANKILEKVGK